MPEEKKELSTSEIEAEIARLKELKKLIAAKKELDALKIEVAKAAPPRHRILHAFGEAGWRRLLASQKDIDRRLKEQDALDRLAAAKVKKDAENAEKKEAIA